MSASSTWGPKVKLGRGFLVSHAPWPTRPQYGLLALNLSQVTLPGLVTASDVPAFSSTITPVTGISESQGSDAKKVHWPAVDAVSRITCGVGWLTCRIRRNR